VATSEKDKHDTVVRSHNYGFYIENRTLVEEVVDIYYYDSKAAPASENS
jgi:hypothetical protein